jgi:hypothetical protein
MIKINFKNYNFLFYAFGIVISFAFFFGSSLKVSATTNYYIDGIVPFYYGGATIVAQDFIMPDHGYISGVSFRIAPAGQGNYNIYLCKGAGFGAGIPASAVNCLGFEMITHTLCNFNNSDNLTDCNFNFSYEANAGDAFFITLSGNPTPSPAIYYGVGTQYPEGDLYSSQDGSNFYYAPESSHLDAVFRVYYDDNIVIMPLEENKHTENYDFSLDSETPDFGTVNNMICFLGNPCNLWYSFNDLAVGKNIYLFNYEDITAPGYEIASSTIQATPLWQNSLSVPLQTTEQIKQYNLLLDGNQYGWTTKTGIKISWLASSTWSNMIASTTGANMDDWCSEENVCKDVATTSDFMFGFQCGFKKTICWSFNPTNGAQKYFANSINALERSFPFNLVFSFFETADQAILTASSSAGSIGIPMIRQTATTSEFYILPVVSTSTFQDVVGAEIYDSFTSGMNKFIWFITGLFCLTIIIVYLI